KLVEVHHMVLHIKRQFHDVANDLGVDRDLDANGVFHRADRRHRVDGGADAANALGESPGITRIASLEDDFNATPHGSAGQRVVDGVVRAQSGFDAKVPFDAGDWVNYDSPCHGSAPRYSFVLSGDFSFPLAASTVRRPT